MKMRNDEMDVDLAASDPRDDATKGSALAPSHDLRSMLGRTRRSLLAFPRALAMVLVGATLSLSACDSAQEAGAAAIVNGTVIGDQEVQTVSTQVRPVDPEAQNPGYVLINLMIVPFVLAEADRANKTISEADARKALPNLVDPSPATIKYLQMKGALGQLDDVSKAAIVKELSKAKVTVNPRYGTFDLAQGLIPNSPNWIKPSATPTPSAE